MPFSFMIEDDFQDIYLCLSFRQTPATSHGGHEFHHLHFFSFLGQATL